MAHYGVSWAPFDNGKVGEWTLIEEFFWEEKALREAKKTSRNNHGPNRLIRLERYKDGRIWLFRYGRTFSPMKLDSYTAAERSHGPQLPFDR